MTADEHQRLKELISAPCEVKATTGGRRDHSRRLVAIEIDDIEQRMMRVVM